MATTLPKLSASGGAEKPWHRYRKEKGWKLLQPGWGGFLDDDELRYIQEKLKVDPSLSFTWGFRPGQKTRSESAIRRVAVHGDSDCRATNVKLARSRFGLSQIGHNKGAGVSFTDIKKHLESLLGQSASEGVVPKILCKRKLAGPLS
jgi:hypothetical protein